MDVSPTAPRHRPTVAVPPCARQPLGQRLTDMRPTLLRRTLWIAALTLVPRGDAGGAPPALPLRVGRASAVRAHPESQGYVVVVHATNPARSLPRDAVSRLFLKKVKRWPAGAAVQPADLPDESPVRAAFSREVLGRDVASVKAYWQQRIFSGQETPPPERASDDEVLTYVRSHAGAIAYVAPRTALPADVHALEVTR